MASEDASDELPASLSPNGPTANHGPSWPRPRSPIPPHRLAKLANALGISTPIPVSKASNDSITSTSLPSKPITPEARRSPAPSVASTSHSPAPLFQSRFLLHVAPPLHIPHESNSSDDFQLTPSPPSASGYHTQFQRGTLVPLLPTLQSQLWAIAKEYALPSTAGMVLYLVSSARIPKPEASLTVPDEPGPRLSEDIWKHLWTRVTKFETEAYSHLATSNTGAGLGLGFVAPPSPLLPYEIPSSSNTLRPLISPGRVTPQSFPLPLTPTGSIASSNPPTQATSSETSQSEVDTPDTSLPSDSRAMTLDLPGLTSPSVIPVLAKVEFDIDKRKAAWYGPWIRSRKLNHQKREQRARTGSDSGTSPMAEDGSRGDTEAEGLKAAPIPLKLVDRQAIPRFLLSAGEEGDDNLELGYPCLSESPPGLEDPDSDSMTLSERARTENDSVHGNDEALWESRERPKLALDIPASPPGATVHPPLPTAGGMTTAAYKKAPPPPLTLMPYSHGIATSAEPSPLPTSDSTGLAYLHDGVSTPSDGSKRTGTVFDELDLGLEFEDTGEFDENDPNDRRRSQYVLKAKLDEIEKTLVRLSPRGMQHETIQEWQPSFPSSVSGGPPEQSSNELSNQPNAAWPTVPYSSRKQDVKADSSLGPDKFLAPPKLSPNGLANSSPMSPYVQSFSTSQGRVIDESNARRGELDGHVLFPEIDSALRKSAASTSPTIPLSPDPFGRFPSSPSPPSTSQASTSLEKPLSQSGARSEVPPERSSRGSLSHKNSLTSRVDAESRPPSSRFSLDSSDEGVNNRTSVSLNPVKSIKSLWKKGRKASISFVAGNSPTLQPGPGRTSPLPPPPVPSLSSTPTTSTPRSLTPAPSTASRESVASLALPADRLPPKPVYYDIPSLSTTRLQQSHSSPSINSMIFNQESPYPVHVISPYSVAQPRTASQAARVVSVSLTDVDTVPATMITSADREKAGAPKSILKSRRTDSSAVSPPSEKQATQRNPPRAADPAVRQSTLTSGGGQATLPLSTSEAARVSPTMSRRRSSRARPLSRPSPDDESFRTVDTMPRLEFDQRTR